MSFRCRYFVVHVGNKSTVCCRWFHSERSLSVIVCYLGGYGGLVLNHTLNSSHGPSVKNPIFLSRCFLSSQCHLDCPALIWSLPNLSTVDLRMGPLVSVNTLLIVLHDIALLVYTLELYGTSPVMWYHTMFYQSPHTSECTLPNPSQKGWYSINLPQRDGRLSWPRWLATCRDGSPVHRRSPIQVLTGLDVVE